MPPSSPLKLPGSRHFPAFYLSSKFLAKSFFIEIPFHPQSDTDFLKALKVATETSLDGCQFYSGECFQNFPNSIRTDFSTSHINGAADAAIYENTRLGGFALVEREICASEFIFPCGDVSFYRAGIAELLGCVHFCQSKHECREVASRRSLGVLVFP